MDKIFREEICGFRIYLEITSFKILLSGGKILLLSLRIPDFVLTLLAFIFHTYFNKNTYIIVIRGLCSLQIELVNPPFRFEKHANSVGFKRIAEDQRSSIKRVYIHFSAWDIFWQNQLLLSLSMVVFVFDSIRSAKHLKIPLWKEYFLG